MRKMLTALLILAAGAASAADYPARAWYWCHQNNHTNVTRDLSQALTMGPRKGALSYIVYNAKAWKFAGPSKATLTALDGPTVDAWVLTKKRERQAAANILTPEAKATIKTISMATGQSVAQVRAWYIQAYKNAVNQ